MSHFTNEDTCLISHTDKCPCEFKELGSYLALSRLLLRRLLHSRNIFLQPSLCSRCMQLGVNADTDVYKPSDVSSYTHVSSYSDLSSHSDLSTSAHHS